MILQSPAALASSLCRNTCRSLSLGLVLSTLGSLICYTSFQAQSEQLRKVFDQAVTDFKNGRIKESVSGFDRLIKLEPEVLPQLWQRGIALYYAGRFEDCRAQFESHRTVNPNDVENAAWHFLCVARDQSPSKAKSALLPVGPDSRVPMSQIYRMLRGELSVEQVLKAGGTQLESQFYAELYAGLYLEALGHNEQALKHIRNAAANRYSGSGYMHDVARVHRDLQQRGSSFSKP